ncbi:MAG: nuclear transport factor 2 family protein [Terriglobales bacterium]
MAIRNYVSIALITLAGFSAGSAQEPIKPALNPRIITATRQVAIFSGLENQLLRAVQSKDQAELSKLVSEDCIIEMPDADPLPCDDWMKSILSKDYVLKTFTVRQLSAVDGADSAVVKFDRVQQSTFKGKPDGGEFFVVDVWKKDGADWKLANRFVSKVSSVPWMLKGDIKPTGKQ